MSQQLTLKISDEAYARLQERANAAGLQVADWIIDRLKQEDSAADLEIGIQAVSISETALLSEQALAIDWNKPEENAAWFQFQSGQ